MRKEQPRVLSQTPSRVRIHLPGVPPERSEADLGRVSGVASVQGNALTSNVLIHFDPRATSVAAILARAEALTAEVPPAAPSDGRLLRAGVRGVLGHALVDSVLYAIVFAEPFGLPLAGLGALHLGFDVVAWTVAFAPLLGEMTPAGGRA